MSNAFLELNREPDLSKIVDQDILDTFENTSVLYGDIINAQLIRTMQELTEQLKLREAINEHKPLQTPCEHGV